MFSDRLFIGIVSCSIFFCHLGKADVVLIDFENFEVGDGLAEINTFYSPFGLSFLSEDPFASIQIHNGSKVLTADASDVNQFDIIINSDFLIDAVSADLLDGDEGDSFDDPAFSILEGYNVPKTPGGDVSGFIFSESGESDVNLSWQHPGPFQTEVLSLHFSQDMKDTDLVRIDNIQITRVPEPSSLLSSIGLLGWIGVRRLRRR